MRKFNFFILAFFFYLIGINAQQNEEKDLEEFFEEVLSNDDEEIEEIPFEYTQPTPLRAERDEIYFREKTIPPNFKDNYQGKKFDYDRKVKVRQREIKEKNINFSFNSTFVKYLTYSILIIMLLVVVYHIFINAGGFTWGNVKKKIKVKYSDSESLIDDDDIENNDFATLIQRAKANQDYKRAVRYYYLWILQKLTERNLIDWHKEKTNYDYFLELDKQNIQTDFSQSNYIFDNIWYGDFPLNELQFEKAESIFKETLHKIQ